MPASTLLRTGELRNPALPATDSESRVDTRPPLMPLSLAISFRFFGVNVAAARIGQFLAAILTILVVYAIGCEVGDPLAGGIAAVVLAADNFFVISSRSARPEAWVALWGACGLLLIIRSHNRHSWKISFLAGLAAALGCLFHVLGLGWFVGLSVILLFQERGNIFRSPRAYAFVAGFALAIIPFLVWLAASPEHIAAAKHMYGKGAGNGLTMMLAKEKLRVLDLIGFSNQRLHLPIPLPLRLHIILIIAAAFAVLLHRRPILFWTLVLATAPQLIWFLRLPNESARYYTVLAPVFAICIGLAVRSLSGTRWNRVAIAVCVVLVATQVVGTAILLNQARKADYPALTARLRAAIPSGHSCYAAMAFQLALADRECHSYDRTPFSYTMTVQRPEYMILGDRVMLNGSGHGEDNYGGIRKEALAFVEQRGQLSARIVDPFYGDLSIYRISYDSPSKTSCKTTQVPTFTQASGSTSPSGK
jgi:4-amino-4-deoxy-L-arabinose transferase-like glycosyltransferase